LLERRDAGCERQRAAALDQLSKVRDRVLEGAEPLAGATVLDVGAGDGLIGLEALERVGPNGSVIFADVSEALLERCRQGVAARGWLDRASFVPSRAEDLAGVADSSVDVVTTRSVLIYVAEKARAFAAFGRVLRSGGRISLFEPINRLMFPEPADRFWGYEVSSVADLAGKVKARFIAPDAAFQKAIRGFDDRDLVRFAQTAGFERVRCECYITVEPGSLMNPVSFQALLDSAPNPNAPTTREAIAAALTEPQQERFLAELKRAYVEGKSIRRMAGAYLVAGCHRP
jgi:arsenite methyltransferase